MNYTFPDLKLLEYHNTKNEFTDRDFVKKKADRLVEGLQSYNVACKVTDARMSPFAILFDVMPDPGVTVKSFTNLRAELEMCMASPVEIVNIGEKEFTLGLVVKNLRRPTIGLRDIMETKVCKGTDYIIPIAAGMNVVGKPFAFDLASTPHLLVAGTTGSGKSTFLNDIILNILFAKTPDEVKFIMIDPKRVELSAYNKIPHMLMPVVSETKDAFNAFKWVDSEMMRRYDMFSSIGVKNLESYNAKVSQSEKMPRIVIIVDEYMEMMFEASKSLEDLIKRLARLARASGIHLVLATQRPSKDVITGEIKANIPCRASFTVVDWRESKTILDRTGAERLLGDGDMLFSTGDASIPVHVQACFVSYDEVDKVIASINSLHY